MSTIPTLERMPRKKVVPKEWRDYLEVIAPTSDVTQMRVADMINDAAETAGLDVAVDQTTVSNWRRGTTSPQRAILVAAVAEAFNRQPLEALIAAGLVDINWVTASLNAASVRTLSRVGIESRKKAKG